jgi:hypothetical protein
VRGRNRRRWIRTLSGKLLLKRNYHHCKECSLGFYPRDAELGLPAEGEVSEELEKRILDFAITDVFQQGADRWNLHYHQRLSDNLLRRVTDRVGIRLEKSIPLHVQRATKPPPTASHVEDVLVVQPDGSMLRTREDGWREAKLAVMYRQSERLKKGRRGILASARYVSVLGPQDEFREELRAALKAEMHKFSAIVVWLCDGAPENWSLCDDVCPGAVQVLDWYHAVENGMKAGRVLLGEGSDCLPTWKQTVETLLAAGDCETLVSELLECIPDATDEGLKALDDLVRYYRNNAERMRYSLFREHGIPIGSGSVESAHKHVLQTRMKRSGQRWALVRARRMVRLRAAYRTAGAARVHAALGRAFRMSWDKPGGQTKTLRRRASNL